MMIMRIKRAARDLKHNKNAPPKESCDKSDSEALKVKLKVKFHFYHSFIEYRWNHTCMRVDINMPRIGFETRRADLFRVLFIANFLFIYLVQRIPRGQATGVLRVTWERASRERELGNKSGQQ